MAEATTLAEGGVAADEHGPRDVRTDRTARSRRAQRRFTRTASGPRAGECEESGVKIRNKKEYRTSTETINFVPVLQHLCRSNRPQAVVSESTE